MSYKKKLEQLREYIICKYDHEQGANCCLETEDKQRAFSAGVEYGKCHALYFVAQVIDLDLLPPTDIAID